VGSKRRPRQTEKHIKEDRRIEKRQDVNSSARLTEHQIEQINNSIRMCERMNEARGERMNDSRISDRGNDSRMSERLERMSDRLNDSRLEDRRKSDLNSSIRIEGSPKVRSHMSPLRVPRSSPKNLPKREHPRQSSSDSGKDFFPPTNLSPLSPNTEESLLSDEERPNTVYSNEPETSKCLAPDSQYETVREEKEEIKTNHHHCYSDTNTMDSGWQSGSEKQVTD
jgi:hypothetical protein